MVWPMDNARIPASQPAQQLATTAHLAVLGVMGGLGLCVAFAEFASTVINLDLVPENLWVVPLSWGLGIQIAAVVITRVLEVRRQPGRPFFWQQTQAGAAIMVAAILLETMAWLHYSFAYSHIRWSDTVIGTPGHYREVSSYAGSSHPITDAAAWAYFHVHHRALAGVLMVGFSVTANYFWFRSPFWATRGRSGPASLTSD